MNARVAAAEQMTSRHLKAHVVFYLGLMQIVVGYFAVDGDLPTVWLKRALAASGILTLVVKYVKDNLPDEDDVPVPITPALTPALPTESQKP